MNYQKTFYRKGIKTAIKFVAEYSPDGKLTKQTQYYSDGKTIYVIQEYDPQTHKRIKETHYYGNGKTKRFVIEYYSDGKLNKSTWFREDGKTINCIICWNPVTAEIIKTINYHLDGTIGEEIINDKKHIINYYQDDFKTLIYTNEYNLKTGKLIKNTQYNPDGTVFNEIYYNPNGSIKTTKKY
ncbi:DUF2963 domain-containing protein [Candidatus Phytoplasma australiense]|uniref:DUF2963 domain-containing protein n=1 Tax=Strawberry lethal yellows phytoplasma (CPA) str. NZSb11 TaxID=980422 RepID=R4S1S1_PHYAS|nr:DUF2963 domain-containing protein [Candidatus Phytoplasma australiense]AGL90140.1 hypothetical protein SLY_0217 [Strawberry lethal yellows phytoplasma (CPA) str. NZSb11]AGL90743.1 Hypothetical Protein SLY_0828 [Strawberry lethal yellows phytoplasma (CPA) str. NZSb11]